MTSRATVAAGCEEGSVGVGGGGRELGVLPGGGDEVALVFRGEGGKARRLAGFFFRHVSGRALPPSQWPYA